MKIGIIFPGQGSQQCGMGKAFYDTERIVQDFFENATACLGINMTKLCFATSDERLRRTVNAQLSLFTLSSALYQLLYERAGVRPAVLAGHSCGEYAALHAAKGISFVDGLHVVKRRAECMEAATQQHEGTMRAIVGLTYQQTADLCAQYDEAPGMQSVVSIANDNAEKQHIIAGTVAAVERVSADARDLRARVLPLSVAGAFHSRLMDDAAGSFVPVLEKMTLRDAEVPIIANSTATPLQKASDLRAALRTQMNSMVRWRETQALLADYDLIIQVGPGTVYTRMLQREHPDCTVLSFSEPADWRTLEEVLV